MGSVLKTIARGGLQKCLIKGNFNTLLESPLLSYSEAVVTSICQIKNALALRPSSKTCCDKSLTLSDDKIGCNSFGHTASIHIASMLSWNEDLHLLLHERIFHRQG